MSGWRKHVSAAQQRGDGCAAPNPSSSHKTRQFPWNALSPPFSPILNIFTANIKSFILVPTLLYNHKGFILALQNSKKRILTECERQWVLCVFYTINFDKRMFSTREYWMIYRGPGFLVDNLAPRPPSPPFSRLSRKYSMFTGDTQEGWERETPCWREREEGVGEEPNHTTARKPDHL